MKVQCEKCKAEYNIDESLIPAEGLQIKCPRCSSTFIVTKGGTAPPTAGDLFDLGNVDLSDGAEDSLELDLPSGPAAPPRGAGSSLPDLGAPPPPPPPGPASSLPEIPQPASRPSPTPGSEGQIFDFIDHDIGGEDQAAPAAKTTRYRIRRKSGKVFGPFDADTVKKMLSEHQLMGNEEASTDGHTFKPLGSFNEFAETIRLLMDEPVISATPDAGLPRSTVEEVDDDFPVETVAPKGVEFTEPPSARTRRGPGAGVFVLIGLILVLVLIGVGLGFTKYGFFGHKLITSSGTTTTGGDTTTTDPDTQAGTGSPARQLYFQDTHLSYEKLIRGLQGRVDDASMDELYLLGLSYAALLRNYGANEGYLAWGRKVLEKMKDENADSPETRKVEAALAILTNPAQAKTLLDPLVGEKSRDKEALFLAGWALAYQKNWREAARFFDRASVIDPDYAKAYHALGDIQSLQGDFDNAMSFYEKAVEKNPLHLNSSVEKARILIEVKDKLEDGEQVLKDVFGKNFQELAPTERAKAHSLRARLHIRKHEHDKAAVDFNAAIQLAPTRVEYLAALGELLLDVGEYPKAVAMFEQALQLEPNNVDALVGKGRGLWQNGDIVKAKLLLEQTANKNTGDPRPQYLLGRIAEDLEKPEEAMAWYNKAVGVAPGFLQSRVAMARLQLKLGEMAKALDVLTEARKLNPRSAIVRNGLGEIYLKQGNLRLAKKEFEEALRLDPELPSAHFNVANVQRDLGHYNQAIESYQKVAELSRRYPDLVYEHAFALFLKKDFAEALKMYEEAIRNNPKDDRLYVRAGLAADASGDTASATRYFQSATGLNNTNVEAYFELGKLFLRQKNYESALELFKQVVELEPTNAEGHHHMGLCYLAMDMGMDAIDEFREAIRLKPNHVDALVELGRALAARLQFTEAIRHFTRVAREQPKRVDVLLALGDAYHKQGMNKQALKTYRKAYGKNPKEPGLAYRLGRAYDDLDQRKQAVRFYLVAVKNDPKDPLPHYYLGHVYKARGANRKALAEFKKYLQLRPDAPDAEEVRDEIYYMQNE